MSAPTSADTGNVTFDRDLVLIGCVGVFVVLVDQGTKWLAELLPSWPMIDATRSGSELFSGADPATLWATPVALVASAAVMALAFGLHQSAHLRWWPVALLAAGAVGTLIDLVAYGSMRTWLIVGPTRWNVAMLCMLAALPSLARATVGAVRSARDGASATAADDDPVVDRLQTTRLPSTDDAG